MIIIRSALVRNLLNGLFPRPPVKVPLKVPLVRPRAVVRPPLFEARREALLNNFWKARGRK